LHIFGLARIGSETKQIISGNIKDLINLDFGDPLHSIIICAKNLHSIEKEMYEYYQIK
jgi:diphthine synthase